MAQLRNELERARDEGRLTFEELAACRDGFCILGATMADVVALVLDFAEPAWIGKLLCPDRRPSVAAERRVTVTLDRLERRKGESGVHLKLAESVRTALSLRPCPALRTVPEPTTGSIGVVERPSGQPVLAQDPPKDEREVSSEPPSSKPNVLRFSLRAKGRLQGW